MKTTLITAVLNEEVTIEKFINSISEQSLIPDEVIVVDGKSSDNTAEAVKQQIKKHKNLNIKLIIKKGNRSVARNEAIKNAEGDIILSSDSGCILNKNWVKNITKSFENKKVDVVAGYYRGNARSSFQKSLIPYVLVMEDRINEREFLPATRSMAFKKSIWKKVGGFNEKLSHNEDYEFAKRLDKENAKIVFSKEAIVSWIPRKNLKQAFVMFFRFALGDIQANILRDKVVYIFLRYLLAVYLLFIGFVFRSLFFWIFYFLLVIAYITWSIAKNYKYVQNYRAILYLPLLQITSDFAVMLGTAIGVIQKISLRYIFKVVLNNKAIFVILLIYIVSILLVIEWGIPNLNHPFTYHMDEWHFSQALRSFLKYGTGSVSGAASIPLYHIVSSIFFLVPFYILHIVNPFAIKYSLDNLPMQHTLFEILRLHTLFYGVLSISVLYSILKKYVKLAPVIFVALFSFTPLWIFLSNFYKYDITLVFWIITTIYFIFKFSETSKLSNFLYAGVACGLALSTKFTAAPLIIGYIASYFIFAKNRKLKEIVISILILAITFLLIGIPDTIFGKGDYFSLLYSNLIQAPQEIQNFNLEFSPLFYLLFEEFPSIFGNFLYIASLLSAAYWTIVLIQKTINKNIDKYKNELFIYIIFIIFFLTSISFGLSGGGNRALVLLPLMVLLLGYFVKDIVRRYKLIYKNSRILITLLILGIFLQTVQSFAWTSVKLSKDPRVASSEWILKYIPYKSKIGIENIPIYQNLPDVVIKEFYSREHNKLIKTKYQYSLVSAETNVLPNIVIITQDYNNLNYIKKSPKKDLVARLNKDGYKKIIVFSPNLRYYDLFSDRMNFIFIYPTPLTISIYEK